MPLVNDYSQHEQAYQQYDRAAQNPNQHEASLTHELLAGAAAFAAAKGYQNHLEANGKPQSHETAKALIAGLAGAFVDREIETKGLDFIDRQKAQHQAQQQAANLVDGRHW